MAGTDHRASDRGGRGSSWLLPATSGLDRKVLATHNLSMNGRAVKWKLECGAPEGEATHLLSPNKAKALVAGLVGEGLFDGGETGVGDGVF